MSNDAAVTRVEFTNATHTDVITFFNSLEGGVYGLGVAQAYRSVRPIGPRRTSVRAEISVRQVRPL